MRSGASLINYAKRCRFLSCKMKYWVIAETKRVIAGAMQTLDSLRSEGIGIALDDTNDSQSSAIGTHAVSSDV